MNEKLKYLSKSDMRSGELFIEKNTNVLVDDNEYISPSTFESIGKLLLPSILVINATDLTDLLSQKLVNSNLEPSLIAFPAKGGLEVKKRLNILSEVPQYDIGSDRSGPQERPRVGIPQALKRILEKKVEKSASPKILLVDDVIGSGKTLDSIASEIDTVVIEANDVPLSDSEYWGRKFPYRNYDFGLPCYSAASWLIYKSTNKYQIDLGLMKSSVISSLEYSGASGKSPVNSLSTLLRGGQKEDSIRKAYANKYSNNPASFIALLSEIGEF